MNYAFIFSGISILHLAILEPCHKYEIGGNLSIHCFFHVLSHAGTPEVDLSEKH